MYAQPQNYRLAPRREVVGAMLSQPGSNAVLTEMSLPSAVYGVLMLVTVAPFVMWRRSLETRG